ncbi:MAG: hypothetical protein QG597_4634 [Actinomycetota bacterium]|nr:hypothetical protein [Actinomycetota bacterium]
MTNDPNTSGNSHDRRPDGTDDARWAPLLVDLPRRFGFSTTDSLVILGIRNGDITAVAQHPVSSLVGQNLQTIWDYWDLFLAGVGAGFDAVSLIAYCDTGDAIVLEGFRETAPLPVADVIVASAGRWWQLECRTPGVCGQRSCGLTGAPLHVGADFFESADGPSDLPKSGEVTRVDDSVLKIPVGHPSSMDAVDARLPFIPTDDPAVNQTVARLLLDMQHTAYTNGTTGIALPVMTAALLTGLNDPQVAEGCLAWDDLSARRMYLDLATAAPPRWSGPAWALIAATAYRHGHLPSFWVALHRAISDQPHHPLAQHLVTCARADTTRDQVEASLAARLARVPDHLHAAPAPTDQ